MRNFLPVVLFLGVVLSCSDDDRNPTASEPLRAAGDGAAGAAKAAAYEVPQSLIDQVVNYYNANKHKEPGHGKNWLRVLLAFDVKPIGMQHSMQYGSDFADLTPMTAAEAEERVQKWEGWQPIYEALTEIEESLEESAAYFANNPLLPQLYWTSHSTSEFPSTASKFPKIRRSNFNGSVVQDVISRLSTLGTPYDLAFSVSIGKLYWTDWGAGKIQRANLDGSHVEDLVTGANGLKAPTFLALDLAGGKMYWTDWGNIQRANLDGSRIEDLITGLNTPNGLALDGYGGKMYWTDSGQIQRANLDGSGVQTLITTGLLDSPRFLALDLAGGKMYWIDRDGSLDRSKIQRASLDGSGVENLVTGLNTPHGLTLDVAGGKMYWTDNGTGKIQCANLDGSRVQDLITGLDNPVGLALDVVGGGPAPIPTVKNVFISSRPASGDTYRAGETIEVTVEFSQPVYVTGVPAVRLSHYDTGSLDNDMVAYYVNVAGSGSVYMVFRYVVSGSNNDLDGISLAHDPIVVNGSTILDKAGNGVDLSYPASRWVKNIEAHKVRGGEMVGKFDLDSDTVAPTPRGITYANNRFYVVNRYGRKKVYVYTIDGQRDTGAEFDLDSDTVAPRGITYANNRFYVVNRYGSKKVYVYTIDGQRDTGAEFDLDSAGDNRHPEGITYANNRFYVVDQYDKVYVYTIDGQRDTGAEFDLDSDVDSYPAGITYANNRFYVVDGYGRKVYVYTIDGQRDTGAEFDLDSDGDSYPAGITYANNRFYVVDGYGRKVYVYTDPTRR